MAKEEGIEVTGTIIEKHPGGIFSVELEDKHKVLAQIAGKLRKHRIRILTAGGGSGEGRAVPLRSHPRTHRLSLSQLEARAKSPSGDGIRASTVSPTAAPGVH